MDDKDRCHLRDARVPLSDAAADRARGAFWGLAIGDALGAAVEFRPPGSFAPVDGYRGGGPHGLQAGGWTDDTSMALAMADSIASVGWDLNDQAARYVRWWRHGDYSVNGRCFDIGIQTRRALATFERTGDAAISGPADDSQSGNGSLMRLAPAAIAALARAGLPDAATSAAQSSLPTHGSEQCRSACRYFGSMLAGLINGESRETVLAPDWPDQSGLAPLHPLIAEVAAGSFRTRQPPEIVGSGWVVRSLEAALWAVAHHDDFESVVLAAVNLGDDADTTGAIAGQIAGAVYGHAAIPETLRSGLLRSDLIETHCERLLVGESPEPAYGED